MTIHGGCRRESKGKERETEISRQKRGLDSLPFDAREDRGRWEDNYCTAVAAKGAACRRTGSGLKRKLGRGKCESDCHWLFPSRSLNRVLFVSLSLSLCVCVCVRVGEYVCLRVSSFVVACSMLHASIVQEPCSLSTHLSLFLSLPHRYPLHSFRY